MKVEEFRIKIDKLPDHVKSEVMDYIEFLLKKYGEKKQKKTKFKFDWEGGLLKLRNKYTSVELQHKASEWR